MRPLSLAVVKIRKKEKENTRNFDVNNNKKKTNSLDESKFCRIRRNRRRESLTFVRWKRCPIQCQGFVLTRLHWTRYISKCKYTDAVDINAAKFTRRMIYSSRVNL